MKVNIALVLVGLLLFGVGLYRIAPLSLKPLALKGFLIQTVPLVIAFLAVLIWTCIVGKTAGLEKGIEATFKVSSNFFPTILFLFPVMGFGTVLAGIYQTQIESMISGTWGYVGTLFASFIVPTSNAVAGPVKICWETPEFRPLILYFLTSAALVCWPIFFFRTMGLTWDIGVQMYKVNWIVSIAILPGFWMWSKAIESGGWLKATRALLHLM